MLTFSRAGLARIFWHAESTAPEECCGILVGSEPEPGKVRVERVVAAANVAPAASRRHCYSLAPETLVSVHREARQSGRQVVGYYHSHPAGPARPSARDLEHAWPGAGYVIVALAAGQVTEMRCFRLRAAADTFDEEAWQAVDDPETV